LYALDIVGQPRYSIQPVLQATQLGIASSAAAGWYRIASLGPTARAKFRIYTSGANLQEQVVVTTAWSAAFSGYPTVRIEDQSSATFAGTAPLFNGQIRTLVYVSSNGTWYLEVYLGSVATAYTLYVQLIEGDASGASITLTSPIVAGSIPTNYTAQPVVPVNSFSVSTWGGGNSALLIDYTGKVGIGTASPGYPLDVAGSMRLNGNYTYIGGNGGSPSSSWAFNHIDTGSTFKAILFGYANSGGNAAEIGFNYSSSGSASNFVDIGFYGSRPLAITYGGKVGIGTTNPGSALSFGALINNKILTLYDGNASDPVSTATFFYGFGINGGTLRYQAAATGDIHRFYCGATLAATIASTSATFGGTVQSNNPAWNVSKYGQANQSGVITYSQTDYSRNVTIVLGSGTVQVPVAGFYQINFHYFIDAGQAGSGGTYFRVNGSKVAARNYSSESQAYRPGHISAVVSVAANDIFSVVSDVILHGNDNCNFSGHLIA
jgi:hypothetical protein